MFPAKERNTGQALIGFEGHFIINDKRIAVNIPAAYALFINSFRIGKWQSTHDYRQKE